MGRAFKVDKKAIMGIGTLIIFIATILVAAVAAAVLISTSNVLQQRSLLVGQEARKSITDGIEVISIMTSSNVSTETFNDFEILVRLSPGSDALQMRKFNLQYTGPDHDSAAVLAYSEDETVTTISSIVDETAYVDVHDIDGDGVTDTVIVINVTNSSEGSPNDFLQFNLSQYGLSNLVPLNANLSVGTTVSLAESGISVEDNYVLGVVSVSGVVTTDDTLPANSITVRQFASSCDFDTLITEGYYCYEIVNGNSDFVLNSGERFKLRYRLNQSNLLNTGEDFTFIFTTEKGRLSEARARTPDVVVSTRAKVWPLG